jgi:hypothetical protein
MILITTYYKPSNKDRSLEIDKCLFKNYNNKYIHKIYLLNDFLYDLPLQDKKNKIEQIIVNFGEDKKLKYSDTIQFINEKLKNNICILSNSDIYFDNSLSKINNLTISNNFYALLRYDEDIKGNKNIFKRHGLPRDDSQDCWIFRSPLNIDINKLNFTLGTPGCDSIIANIVHECDIKVSNPSLDIITTHVHNTNYRTYNDSDVIHGKYALLTPCKIGEYPNVNFINY